MIIHKVSSKEIHSVGFRLDSSYHLSTGNSARRDIMSSPYGIAPIGEYSQNIFYGNRAKRIYVKKSDAGVPFLSSSDILKSDFDSVKLVSKKYTPNIDELVVKYGWTLITRSGTVGNTAFCTNVHAGKLSSDHVIRVVPNGKMKEGCLYAYLSSKYGYSLLTQGMFGAVIQSIEPKYIESLPIPIFPEQLQVSVDSLIQESAKLREEGKTMLEEADKLLKAKANLADLTPEDYDYYGHHPYYRKTSCFSRNIQEIGTTSFNAFNHSERLAKLKSNIKCNTIALKDAIQNGQTFSSTGAPNNEVKPGHGVLLINQKDIFDHIIQGKWISKRGLKMDNLVEYGEVLIASDGTLGENETFCRAIFASEDLQGAFLSSHFIRMKTNGVIPSGYLYAWLSSDYGFRLIRNTQAGTKLCHPINRLLLQIPIPVIDKEAVNTIDKLVKEAHTKRYLSKQKELLAIHLIEQEIEKWNK